MDRPNRLIRTATSGRPARRKGRSGDHDGRAEASLCRYCETPSCQHDPVYCPRWGPKARWIGVDLLHCGATCKINTATCKVNPASCTPHVHAEPVRRELAHSIGGHA